MGYFQVFWSNYEYFQIFCGISDILIVFNGAFYDLNGILRGILKMFILLGYFCLFVIFVTTIFEYFWVLRDMLGYFQLFFGTFAYYGYFLGIFHTFRIILGHTRLGTIGYH